jgi:hypothetical protein
VLSDSSQASTRDCFLIERGPPLTVIAGLDPAIHVLNLAETVRGEDVDARVKPGHDNQEQLTVDCCSATGCRDRTARGGT